MCAVLAAAADKRPAERVSPPPQCNSNAVVWRTPQPPRNPQAGDVWINPKDGMAIVYISAGEFIMGTSDAEIEAWNSDNPALSAMAPYFFRSSRSAACTSTLTGSPVPR
jgi:hypothetical protein